MYEESRVKATLRALSEGIEVWQLDKNVFVCPSSSRGGIAYQIQVVNGEPKCSCAGFKYRNICKHAAAVAMRLESDKYA